MTGAAAGIEPSTGNPAKPADVLTIAYCSQSHSSQAGQLHSSERPAWTPVDMLPAGADLTPRQRRQPHDPCSGPPGGGPPAERWGPPHCGAVPELLRQPCARAAPWGPGSSGTGAAAHPGVDQKSPPAGGAPLPQICGAAWNLPAQACRLQVCTAPEEQACRPHVPHSRQRPAPLRFYAILSVLGRLA